MNDDAFGTYENNYSKVCCCLFFFIGELPFLTVLKSIVIIIAIFEDGATDRTGDVREALPSGGGGGGGTHTVHFIKDT